MALYALMLLTSRKANWTHGGSSPSRATTYQTSTLCYNQCVGELPTLNNTGGGKMVKHHTKEKGDLGVLKVKLSLFEQGYLILNPETEHAPFDLVAYKNGEFLRIQVKYRSMRNGAIEIPTSTSWADKNGSHRRFYDLSDLDYFAMFCPEVDKCYFVPTEDMLGKTCLKIRINEAKNNQVIGIVMASNYEKI